MVPKLIIFIVLAHYFMCYSQAKSQICSEFQLLQLNCSISTHNCSDDQYTLICGCAMNLQDQNVLTNTNTNANVNTNVNADANSPVNLYKVAMANAIADAHKVKALFNISGTTLFICWMCLWFFLAVALCIIHTATYKQECAEQNALFDAYISAKI